MIKLVKCAEWLDIAEAQPLIAEYAAECSIPAIGKINPQGQTYVALEAAGMMQSFAAYDQGKLAGFANVLITIMPHYGVKLATIETMFVAREYRSSGCGKELMHAIESYSQDAYCVGVLYSSPAGGQLERLLDASKQYQRTNTVFYRRFV